MSRLLLAVAAVSVSSPLTLADDARTSIGLTPQQIERCRQVLEEGLRSEEFWPSIHAAEGLSIGGFGETVRRYLEPKLKTKLDDQQRCGVSRELMRAGNRQRAKIMLDILAGKADFGHIHAAESLYKLEEIGDGVAMR